MQYLLMIYENENGDHLQGEKIQEIYQGYNAFNKLAVEKGAMADANALMPTSTSTTVRIREGRALITDGPFAETKEQITGYYLLNCKDLDDAIELAKNIPSAVYGSIEIRPVRAL